MSGGGMAAVRYAAGGGQVIMFTAFQSLNAAMLWRLTNLPTGSPDLY
jgi:hypothetical protein